MNLKYTLSSGTTIEMENYDIKGMFNNDYNRPTITVNNIFKKKRGKKVNKKILTDCYGQHIIWNNEKVYLKLFNGYTTEELIKMVNICVKKEDPWILFNDDIYAAFIANNESLGFLVDMPMFETLIPQMGIGIVGSKTTKVLCQLSEKQYKKDQWSYKVTMEPVEEKYRGVVPDKHFYFDDFCSLMKKGQIEIVNKNTYNPESIVSESPEKTNALKRFFKKVFKK